MKTENKRLVVGMGLGLVVGALGVVVGLGPLSPPAGVVTGTAKPLSEVEPRIAISAANTPGDADSVFKITAAGSYYLTGNVTGVSGKAGIEIATSGVTVDLNGFELAGVSGSLDGVREQILSLVNVAVVNGTVRGWGGYGVDLSNGTHQRVAGILARDNGTVGLRVGGLATVTDCVAVENGPGGISTSISCVVSGCSASLNNGVGISTGGGCVVTGCTVYGNSLTGISGGTTTTVERCTAQSNGGTGIFVNTSSTVSNCIANGNQGQYGIQGSAGCVVSGCSALSNTSALTLSYGIGVGVNSTVTGSTASSNLSTAGGLTGSTGGGFSLASGSTIQGCAAASNKGDGITMSANCAALNNSCSSNGAGSGDGAGIRATSGNTRIEGNNVASNDRGIETSAAGAIVLRNSAAGNATNFVLAANTVFGTIVDRTAPANAAVSGNAAASSLGTTDANGNWAY